MNIFDVISAYAYAAFGFFPIGNYEVNTPHLAIIP